MFIHDTFVSTRGNYTKGHRYCVFGNATKQSLQVRRNMPIHFRK
jgi:hypothetical protein